MSGDPTDLFERERPRLTALAYRMLGERSLAEDTVQEAWLRWQAVDVATLRSPAAWLTTVTTRLALDALRRAKARRETYVGPWLPEPIAEDAFAPETLAGDLSIALLHVLERLSPDERAAFILREAFDYDYEEIAAVLGKTEAACRKLVSRAKPRLANAQPRFPVDRAMHVNLLERFAAAAVSQDVAALTSLLKEDVISYNDGGGRVAAALNPIRGRDRVLRLYFGLAGKLAWKNRARLTIGQANGEPALFLYEADRLDSIFAIQVEDGAIAAIFNIRNPEKLAHLAGAALH
ncbi:MAG: sigma-70 family RNA polymerase sigma factor [Alphaproteobacteria bacterium]|nr:sigma-70 family RNA polymerase sigma factor [Alphaproteobacteria bacterium]